MLLLITFGIPRILICYGQIRWDMYSLTGFLRSRMTFAWRRLFSGMVKRFVREIIYHIACDVVEEKGKSHDLRLCGTEEREEIQKRLLPYLRQLPEYEHLVEELFED